MNFWAFRNCLEHIKDSRELYLIEAKLWEMWMSVYLWESFKHFRVLATSHTMSIWLWIFVYCVDLEMEINGYVASDFRSISIRMLEMIILVWASIRNLLSLWWAQIWVEPRQKGSGICCMQRDDRSNFQVHILKMSVNTISFSPYCSSQK